MDTSEAQRAILAALHRKFIDASHILHHQGVLDAYGHLSVRHPFNAETFIMSRNMPPGTMSGADDLIEYYIRDAEPVDPAAASKGFAERHIHSELYRRHEDVAAVVHSHADSVIPYTITGVPLRPCYHMAGFLGLGAKGWPEVYDVADHLLEGDTPDMLVRSRHLGEPLAACFDGGAKVALMRGHGMTIVAPGVEEVVSRCVYTMRNASIQTAAMAMQSAFAAQGDAPGPGSLKFLDNRESEAATQMSRWSAQRPWKLWVREVEASGLYLNSA